MRLKKEERELLKKEIKLVHQSRLKAIVGALLLVINILLIFFSYLDLSTLVFTIVLVFSVWYQVMDCRTNIAVLCLMRYIINDDYKKDFDKELAD